MKPAASMPGHRAQLPGFTSLELVIVLALSAVILGGMVVSYGTLVRSQPQVAGLVQVPLTEARIRTFYSVADTNYRNTPVSPSLDALAMAEELREKFYEDVQGATAVFCLARADGVDNAWKPAYIRYTPETDEELDTPQKFRDHIIRVAGVSASQYQSYRNPGTSQTGLPPNASIFILSYSYEASHMRVLAIYDIDMLRFPARRDEDAKFLGLHASVKRYADPPGPPAGTFYSLIYASGYSVFFPPSNPAARTYNDMADNTFVPLYVTFERSTRLAHREGTAVDRFKLAAERPFYFVWWPDPMARHLGPQANTAPPTLPLQAYNHQGGRTSFMFTVPMFPAL